MRKKSIKHHDMKHSQDDFLLARKLRLGTGFTAETLGTQQSKNRSRPLLLAELGRCPPQAALHGWSWSCNKSQDLSSVLRSHPTCCMLRLQDRACNCMPGKDSWQCRSRDGCLFPDEKQLNHQATKSECNHGLKEVVGIREDWEKIIRPIALHKGGKRRLELSHFWSREVDSHSLFSCEKGLFYKLLGKKRLVKANCSCLSYLDISLPSPVRMDKMKGTAQKGK